MCRNNYIKVFSKILLFGFLLVFNLGANLAKGAEPLNIVTNSDKYPAESGPFLSVQPVGGDWSTPYQIQNIKYVGILPSDVVLNSVGYYSPNTGKAYFYVSDARSMYVPGPYTGIANAVNSNLDRFGLGSVIDRQRAIDSLTLGASSVVDVRSLGNRLLAALVAWVVASLVIGLPVVGLILGWRRLFQMFLIHEVSKAVRGREDGRED